MKGKNKDVLDQAFDDLVASIDQKKLKNYVAFILDRSGSMSSMWEAAIDGFNTQVEALKNSQGEMHTFLSLVTFSTKVDRPWLWCRGLSDAPLLTKANYKPDASTALYDAVGMTINKLNIPKYTDDPFASFLIIIISDGFENASVEFTSESLSDLVKTVQGTGKWTFTYIGSKQDLAEAVATMNMDLSNVVGFTGALGYAGSSETLTAGISNYMSSRSQGFTVDNNMYRGQSAGAGVTLYSADEGEAKKLEDEIEKIKRGRK